MRVGPTDRALLAALLRRDRLDVAPRGDRPALGGVVRDLDRDLVVLDRLDAGDLREPAALRRHAARVEVDVESDHSALLAARVGVPAYRRAQQPGMEVHEAL